MLKGLVITPPVIGRISIGKVVERKGKRLPEKDDAFTLTTQLQNAEGWIPHPLDAVLKGSTTDKEEGNDKDNNKGKEQTQQHNQTNKAGKLRSIPIKLLFDDPTLNMRSSYCLFDRQTGRPLCVGNGVTCKRSMANQIENMPCPAPEGCDIGANGNCKPYARLHVRVDAEHIMNTQAKSQKSNHYQDDALSSFVFRTTGFNSIRTITARLQYYAAVSGSLSTMPLQLKLRGKSTTQSYRKPIYYVDVTTRDGEELGVAVQTAQAEAKRLKESGYDQAALEQVAREGYAQGAFEEVQEDGMCVVEEFYAVDLQQT